MTLSYKSSVAGAEGSFRLTDTRPGATPDSESGTLEVFHAGAWGTICSDAVGIPDVCAGQLLATIIDCA